MELKKLPVNDNIRASYEANKLCFPSIIWNVTNNTKPQKWQFLRNVLATLNPLGSQTYSWSSTNRNLPWTPPMRPLSPITSSNDRFWLWVKKIRIISGRSRPSDKGWVPRGGTRDFKRRGWSNGAKSQDPKKSLGLPAKPKKNPWTKN